MGRRKIPVANDDQNGFSGYAADEQQRLLKGCKVDWRRSTLIELHELYRRLSLTLAFDADSDLYSISVSSDNVGVVSLRYTDASLLYTAINCMEAEKDLQHWMSLQRQGRLLVETTPFAGMTCSVGHLINRKVNDHLTRFVSKGRLQLLETNSVISSAYYPADQSPECGQCGFHTDSNFHVLNGCGRLNRLYVDV